MKRIQMFATLLLGLSVLFFGVGCGTAPAPEIESLTLSKTTVAPGDSVDLTLKVKNFSIVPTEGGHNHGDHNHGDHNHGDKSGDMTKGHYHVYFNDKTEVVAMATKETVSIKIPDDMKDGEHKIRVELVSMSHAVLNPNVTQEVKFTVKK